MKKALLVISMALIGSSAMAEVPAAVTKYVDSLMPNYKNVPLVQCYAADGNSTLQAYVYQSAGIFSFTAVIGNIALSKENSVDFSFEPVMSSTRVMFENTKEKKLVDLPALGYSISGFQIVGFVDQKSDLKIRLYRSNELSDRYACSVEMPSKKIKMGVDVLAGQRLSSERVQ